MSKQVFLYIVILVLAGVIAACSGGSRPSSPGAQQAAPAPGPTATAAQVIATITAEAQATPPPDAGAEVAALAAFETWAAANGVPYRDAQLNVVSNDGFFATVQALAWFRPTADAPWEEQEATVECKRVGNAWQCGEQFAFSVTSSELQRRADATATAVAVVTGNMPEGLRRLGEQYGMEFVYVPAGEFMMGMNEAEMESLCDEVVQQGGDRGYCEELKRSMPQHPVALAGFWLGKTEVTNAQYQAFVATGGYQHPKLWTEAGWQWREGSNATQSLCWDQADYNQPDQPACVSWYEAMAYVNWLSEQAGVTIRLPSDAEWEKAACGTDGRIYPWGDEPPDATRANTSGTEDGYEYAAPVGSYPADVSPYGVLDMAGNVNEWTSSKSLPYPYVANDGRENPEGDDERSVRGGSWYDLGLFVHCAVRGNVDPDHRYESVGFRLVSPGFGS